MKKRKNQFQLLIPYLYQIFQKMNNIIFIVSLLIITVGLFLMANPWYDRESYSIMDEGFYQAYFTKALFLLSFSNGILVTALAISMSWDSKSFDIFLLSRYGRRTVALSKIMALFVVILFLSLYEYIILYLFPYILYPSYRMGSESLLMILYIFLSCSFWMFLSMGAATLIPSFFTPLLILILNVILSLLSQAFSKVNESLSYAVPIISYKDGGMVFPSSFIMPILILLFLTFYVFIFEIRDLKE